MPSPNELQSFKVVTYPKPLVAGSTIAITAFSSGLKDDHAPRFELVCEHLSQQGFELVIGQCLFGEVDGASASAADRADELMAFLLSDRIDAIYPPWGGELAIELLPLLDYEALAKAKPKWIMGFSDVSTLAVALTSKLGWATAHTPNLMDLTPAANDTLTEHTLSNMATETGARLVQRATSHYASQWTDFTQDPSATLRLDTLTQWRWLVPPKQGEHVSGRLIGGCWDTLIHLFGTEYCDLKAIKKASDEGVLLFLENAEMSPQALTRAIVSMRTRGVFEQVSGLMLGRNSAMDNPALSYKKVVDKQLKHLGIPVAMGLDIGHLPPNLTLINGSAATLEIGASNQIVQALI